MPAQAPIARSWHLRLKRRRMTFRGSVAKTVYLSCDSAEVLCCRNHEFTLPPRHLPKHLCVRATLSHDEIGSSRGV